MDNNTLAYMHINIASRWEGPMKKSTFLTCEQGVDMGGTAERVFQGSCASV